MKRSSLTLAAAAVAVAFLLASADPARAAFSVNINFNGTSITTIDDGGPGDLLPGVANSIVVAQPISVGGELVAIVTVTATTNAPGSGGSVGPLVDLAYSVSTIGIPGGGGTVQITTSATGFTAPGANPLTLTSEIGGTSTNATVSAQQWANLGDVLFGLGSVTPGVQGPFTGSPYANEASVNFSPTDTFSITDRVTVTLGDNAIATGDLESQVTAAGVVIPVPAGLVMALTGLPCLGVGALLRRRFGKKAA